MQVGGQLGKLIERTMERRRMSVPKLATRAGLSVSGVYKIIQGSPEMPTRRSLEAIADALALPVEDLWDAAQTDRKPIEHLSVSEYDDGVWVGWTRRLIQLTKSLPPEEVERLRANVAEFIEFQVMKREQERPANEEDDEEIARLRTI